MCPSKALMIIHSDSSTVSQKSNLVILHIYSCRLFMDHVGNIQIMQKLFICLCIVDTDLLPRHVIKVCSFYVFATKAYHQGMFILCICYLSGTAVIVNKYL